MPGPKKRLTTSAPLSKPAVAQEDYTDVYPCRFVFEQKPDGPGLARIWICPSRDDGGGGIELAQKTDMRVIEITNVATTADADENSLEADLIRAIEAIVEREEA